MHILLVEDDKTIIETLTEFLRQEDFQVTNVDNQKDALTLVEEKEFDLVLLDITLREGSGYNMHLHESMIRISYTLWLNCYNSLQKILDFCEWLRYNAGV